MIDHYLSIGQAARLLGVSVDTLRRMEDRNELVPERSDGGHRRYKLSQVEGLRKKTNGELNTIFSHCTKVADFKKVIEELCSEFDPNEVVTLAFNQHSGFPGVSVFIEGKTRFTGKSIPFIPDRLLDDECDSHILWHKEEK
jgi:excisionase family DNA binding protein